MGIAGISIWQLLILLLIVLLLFGSKRLGTLGGDLGRAISGFRKAVSDPTTDDHRDNEPVARPADRR